MRKLSLICALLLLIALASSTVAQSGPLPTTSTFDSPPPPPPQAFYGNATLCGRPAPIGTVVEARGANVKVGIVANPITTTVTGKYGGPTLAEVKLGVQGWIENGTPISFYLNNVRAQVSSNGVTWVSSVGFVSGVVTRLHLRVLRCHYIPIVMK